MKKLTLIDAIEIAEKLEKMAELHIVNPFISISMFEEDADKTITKKQNETYEEILDMLKIYQISTELNSRIDEAKSNAGLLSLEKEKAVAEKWLSSIEKFFKDMEEEQEQVFPPMSSIEDAKIRKVKFSSLSDQQSKDLRLRIVEGTESLIELEKKIKFLMKVENVEISTEEIELLSKFLPDYKFV